MGSRAGRRSASPRGSLRARRTARRRALRAEISSARSRYASATCCSARDHLSAGRDTCRPHSVSPRSGEEHRRRPAAEVVAFVDVGPSIGVDAHRRRTDPRSATRRRDAAYVVTSIAAHSSDHAVTSDSKIGLRSVCGTRECLGATIRATLCSQLQIIMTGCSRCGMCTCLRSLSGSAALLRLAAIVVAGLGRPCNAGSFSRSTSPAGWC